MKILWRSVTQGLELYWTRWRDLRGLSEYSVWCSLYSWLTVPLSDRSHLHWAHQTFLYQGIIRRCHDNASIRYVEILNFYPISLRSQYVVKRLMTIDISGSFLHTAVSLTDYGWVNWWLINRASASGLCWAERRRFDNYS